MLTVVGCSTDSTDTAASSTTSPPTTAPPSSRTSSSRTWPTTPAGLGITVADFNALVEDLVISLDTFEVPEAEKTELLNARGPMQTDIVEV